MIIVIAARHVLILCVIMHTVHAHGNCCWAMHACVGVCVWACARRMPTVIAARRCMRVSDSVFGLVQGCMLVVIAERSCMHMHLVAHLNKVYGHGNCCKVMHKAYAHNHVCEAMHVCM